MSRREEVDKVLRRERKENVPIETYHALARRIADEVDELRADLLALGKKATRYENEREINAGLVNERDTIIDKLLAMLMPDESIYHMSIEESNKITSRYARACEIAGRK